MLWFMLVAVVLIGLAYADLCLIDNTEHFGLCFGKSAEAEAARAERVEGYRRAFGSDAASPESPDAKPGERAEPERSGEFVTVPSGFGEFGDRRPETVLARRRRVIPVSARPARSRRLPAPTWLLPELDPPLEMREEAG